MEKGMYQLPHLIDAAGSKETTFSFQQFSSFSANLHSFHSAEMSSTVLLSLAQIHKKAELQTELWSRKTNAYT